MKRLQFNIRKILTVKISYAAGEREGYASKRALSVLFFELAKVRQAAHVWKVLGRSRMQLEWNETREGVAGALDCKVGLIWADGTTFDHVMELCDWLAPVLFQALRERESGAAIAALRGALKTPRTTRPRKSIEGK
jgi:hypothetical protein